MAFSLSECIPLTEDLLDMTKKPENEDAAKNEPQRGAEETEGEGTPSAPSAPEGAAAARGDDDKADPPEASTDASLGDQGTGLPPGFTVDMPAPQAHAIEQHRAEEAEKAQRYSGVVDADGVQFDPTIHVSDANGEPVKTTKKKWRKRPGRKASAESGQSRVSAPSAPKVSPVDESRAKSFATGKFAAASLIQLGIVVGGEEWHPMKNDEMGVDERGMLENAFGEFFAANDMTDIPPGWALVIAVGGYALPRLGAPKTRTRLEKAKEWLFEKYLWFKRKSEKRRKEELKGRNEQSGKE